MNRYGQTAPPRAVYKPHAPTIKEHIDGAVTVYDWTGKPHKFPESRVNAALDLVQRLYANKPTRPVYKPESGRPRHLATITWHTERHAFTSGVAVFNNGER